LTPADRQKLPGEAPSEEACWPGPRGFKAEAIKLEEEVKRLKGIEKVMLAAPDQQVSFTRPDSPLDGDSGRGSGMGRL